MGSVDSFERKLDEAQEDLGWSPEQYVPVTYVNEMNWTGELGKYMLPIIILAGSWWLLRAATKDFTGSAGMGGGRGLFNVGKAKVSSQNFFFIQQIETKARSVILSLISSY